MKVLIVVVIAFLAAVYVFTFIKWRRRKNHGVNAVADFRKKYIKSDIPASKDDSVSKEIKKTVTKYNSQIDYMEHDEFLKDPTIR